MKIRAKGRKLNRAIDVRLLPLHSEQLRKFMNVFERIRSDVDFRTTNDNSFKVDAQLEPEI